MALEPPSSRPPVTMARAVLPGGQTKAPLVRKMRVAWFLSKVLRVLP
uniref:Uncharacterized protein n=1 Tax=Anguilla anguilla TaxID=7936 RepID=A0A0E9X206_ANGAN